MQKKELTRVFVYALQILSILHEYHANIGEDKATGMSDVVNMKEVVDDLMGFLSNYIATSGDGSNGFS
jgi:hypothetical protein